MIKAMECNAQCWVVSWLHVHWMNTIYFVNIFCTKFWLFFRKRLLVEIHPDIRKTPATLSIHLSFERQWHVTMDATAMLVEQREHTACPSLKATARCTDALWLTLPVEKWNLPNEQPRRKWRKVNRSQSKLFSKGSRQQSSKIQVKMILMERWTLFW